MTERKICITFEADDSVVTFHRRHQCSGSSARCVKRGEDIVVSRGRGEDLLDRV